MKIRLLLYIVTGIVITGCENFVEVDLPQSFLTGQQVFADKSTVEAALSDVYSKLRDDGVLNGGSAGSAAMLGLYADELLIYNAVGNSDENIFNNVMLASNPTALTYWNTGYHNIYCCNIIIEGVNASTALSSEDKQRFVGEALFIRALVHFYLLNIFGDIPYIETTNYELNSKVGRMPANEVYSRIIADLSQAAALLPDQYSSQERITPNKFAATALLARVFLYNEQWEEAMQAASKVIDAGQYVLETDLDQVFVKFSQSTIWQFKPRINGTNAMEGSTFIFMTTPPPALSLREELVNAFEIGDLRKQYWVKAVTDGTTTWFHSFKYKQNSNTGTSLEYSIVLRLEELYLIRAEAYARQENLDVAADDLNKIRSRAGLPDTSASGTEQMLLAIEKERNAELFTEYGHRFFDLKRTGRTNQVLPMVKPGWDDNDNHWPLPEAEMLVNLFLVPQNPGY